LVALTSLINSVPKAMFLSELPTVGHSSAQASLIPHLLWISPKIIPFLLRGLDVPDEEMRANTINTLNTVAKDESSSQVDVITEHASTIVTALLRNADYEITKSPVREQNMVQFFQDLDALRSDYVQRRSSVLACSRV
jgi:DNA repair/transcription protein MET18/MMS19